MFKRFSTELAVVFVALFGAVMLLIAGGAYVAGESNMRESVRADVAVSSAEFDRLPSTFARDNILHTRTLENGSIADAKTLQSFDNSPSASVLLQYAPPPSLSYDRSMLLGILLIFAAGLGVLVVSSWLVSDRVTGPVFSLRAAAARLAQGERVEVHVSGRNEFAELAADFNIMSGEIAAREQRITHLALHDHETGLPNLRAMEARLAAMRQQHASNRLFGAMIGVDRFQHVRGAIGHAASTRLIGEIAGRISAAYPEVTVSRVTAEMIGGAFHADSPDAALRTAEAISDLISRPLRLGDDCIDVRITIGVAGDCDNADTDLSLIERAEVAVEQARRKRERCALFDRAAYGDPKLTLSLMSSLIDGLGRDQFYLAHQSKLDLRTGAVTGAESLIRWRHPERGDISPDQFIPMAEVTGHIRPLTDWMLDRAIADQRRMREAGFDMPLTINISGRMMTDAGFVERALRQIRRANARLMFDITETAVLDNPAVARLVMNELSRAGVGVSISDFGSGPASRSCLRTLPAQELKIGRMLVQGMAQNRSDDLLVQSAIAFAHSLGMTPTADGVESAETLALLKTMGADVAQGYFIALPLATPDFVDFMQKQQPHDAALTG